MTAADNHRHVAGEFARLVDGTADWDAPTPVPEWRAHDVVEHLLGWLPPVLRDWAAVDLPDSDGDLPDRWRDRAEQVQRLLDDPGTAEATVAFGPFAGGTVGGVIDQLYCSDIYQHTWDLARSTGQEPRMDPETTRGMLAGMQGIEEMLRSSGQYGPAQHTDSDDPVDRLVAFIGRDPQWRPDRSD